MKATPEDVAKIVTIATMSPTTDGLNEGHAGRRGEAYGQGVWWKKWRASMKATPEDVAKARSSGLPFDAAI